MEKVMENKEKIIQTYIKIAKKEKMQTWRNENKEHLREYHRNWRERNRDKIKQYNENYWRKQAILMYEQAKQN